MGFDTTPIKTNKLVYKHKLHFENPNSLWFLLLKLYYMGRTAAQFAESSVPNGIQRKIPPAQIQKKKEQN